MRTLILKTVYISWDHIQVFQTMTHEINENKSTHWHLVPLESETKLHQVTFVVNLLFSNTGKKCILKETLPGALSLLESV